MKALEKVKETVAFSEMIRDTIGHRSLTICEDRDYPPGSYFALERLISVKLTILFVPPCPVNVKCIQ